ncbi:MAG: 2-amino-4-hydroxy-6-hydroxymethyldihydropteridine diphosphokinase [Candidatus Omnitrophica bacterium]|nr:2-amino-4-hydroxy-6-hydroxymethyldihydropteridine diphosphokinase [Candidatus Omnitrophota bacterium]
MSQQQSRVYLGVGSNIGDRRVYIDKAILLLRQNINISLEQVSQLYETDPVGGPVQGKFLNGVIELNTSLTPLELLKNLQDIEVTLGRIRSGLKNQPRTLDLDILLFSDIVLNTLQLTIPHPMVQDRLFVLKPFAEIAPEVIHPIFKQTIKELLSALNGNLEFK